MGALLTVASYSSLAMVLLTATLAVSGMVPMTVALGLVLGANLGSGLLAVMLTARAPMAERRLAIGNLFFKLVGAIAVIPLLPYAHVWLQQVSGACTSRWCCSTSASTWRWRCCSSASPASRRGC